MKCEHKFSNGDSALEIADKNLLMSYPPKYNVKCLICKHSFALPYDKLPLELQKVVTK